MDTEKILKGMAETARMAAEAVKDSTVGTHVARIVERGDDLSLQSLLDELQRSVAQSTSARGKGRPEHDLDRIAAETALVYLRTLTERQ